MAPATGAESSVRCARVGSNREGLSELGSARRSRSQNLVKPSERTATDALRNYLAADWKRWLTEYPELATNFGFPGLNDRWTDDSPAGIERRVHHLSRVSDAVRWIPSI